MFDLSRLDEISQNPQDFMLLEQNPLTQSFLEQHLPFAVNEQIVDEEVASLVILDTETTGLSAASEKIIELAILKCTFSTERQILLSIDLMYDEFEDPNKPITPEVSKLTGITQDMVQGKAFDDVRINEIFSDNPLVIAHNARFDRVFFEQRFPSLAHLSWACSLVEVDWSSLGDQLAKLEYLTKRRGYFYPAHRAINDCLALALVFLKEPASLDMLLTSSSLPTYRIDVKLDFKELGLKANEFNAVKEKVKELNFRFDMRSKNWYIQVNDPRTAHHILGQLRNLRHKLYDIAAITIFSSKERYKDDIC